MANQLNNKLEPEDIFAETEKAPSRQAAEKPGQNKYTPLPAQLPETPGKPKSYRWLIILVIIVFVIIIAGIIVSATGILNKKTSANNNMNINAANNDAKTNVNVVLPTNSVNYPVDSDQDGLSDEEEKSLGTNPNSSDTDSDGLSDRDEVKIYKTDPNNPDSDGDGHSDGDEVKAGYNPLGEGKLSDFTNAVNKLTNTTK